MKILNEKCSKRATVCHDRKLNATIVSPVSRTMIAPIETKIRHADFQTIKVDI